MVGFIYTINTVHVRAALRGGAALSQSCPDPGLSDIAHSYEHLWTDTQGQH